jgi:hypothetical protein
MAGHPLKNFFVPESKLILFHKNVSDGTIHIENTKKSISQLLTKQIFSTTNKNKYLILHIGALGFSGTDGQAKSSCKLKDFISTLEKPYELVIVAIDALFIDPVYKQYVLPYIRNLGLTEGARYVNPKLERDGTFTKLIIIPGYLDEDTECIKFKAYYDMQKPDASFLNYVSYPIIKNDTSRLIGDLFEKAIDEGGTIFIQSYLNWDETLTNIPFALGKVNIGSNFENLVSLVQHLYKLDHGKLMLIPHNNRCEKYGDDVIDVVHPFFSPEAVTKFIDNGCVSSRIRRNFKTSDFVMNAEQLKYIEDCLKYITGEATGGAGSRRRHRRTMKKLRRSLRRKC